jgi:long-chain acyl-CoA synthetase
VEKEEKMAVNNQMRAPVRKPNSNTIPRLLWQRVNEMTNRPAMREKQYGIWKNITWREYGEKVKWVALGLIELGLKKEDKVAIISENNPEWLYTDLGTQCAGGISVGIYTTNTPNQVEYVVSHSQAKFYICENEEQLDKILEVRDRLPDLEKIIIMDMEGLRDFSDPMAMSFDDLLELGCQKEKGEPGLFEKLLNLAQPDDVAFLVYTSGTTGPPKGAMLTHNNVLKVMDSLFDIVPAYTTDNLLTFLPLCHIVERNVTAMGMLTGGYTCNFAEEMGTVPQDIREVSPTIFIAVPRIWEKFYSGLVLRMKDSTWLEKKMYDLALRVGRWVSEYRLKGEKTPAIPKTLFSIANWTVLRNLKRSVGLDRVRIAISGAAPIAPDLLRFYHGLGIDIREGYGQTESGGVATLHHDGDVKFGTIGKAVLNCEIKLSEEGEILIKSPTVFKGYYRDPEKTAETIIDGWLYTGDVGKFDEDDHLIITDRKKDIIITAGGKNITPSEIENELKFSPYINDAVVIGDKKKYLTALIMVDDENVMKYAQDNRVPFTTYASLTKTKEVNDLIQMEVNRANKKFARVETIKKFSLIDIQLTTDDEEITPTGKLKRNFVSKKFKQEIESMY